LERLVHPRRNRLDALERRKIKHAFDALRKTLAEQKRTTEQKHSRHDHRRNFDLLQFAAARQCERGEHHHDDGRTEKRHQTRHPVHQHRNRRGFCAP
jgi:hypothetical protein